MFEHRVRRGAALAIAVVLLTSLLALAGTPHSGTARTGASAEISATVGMGPSTDPTITNFAISPNPATQGNQFTVSVTVSGGFPPYTFNWNPIPPFCTAGNVSQWNCGASQSGNYPINVTVVDASGNHTDAGRTLTINSNNGNGNGNGNGNSNNNNGSGNSSGLNLSGLGNILVYALVGGIISFALLVVLTVGVLLIAITLRRLPRPPKGPMVCPACQGHAPAGSKFCPACAAPLAPPK
jgi:hypothetical protein